eukprot:CAMPEP_0113551798 /NCGR_PEP_ID=MMETSP0015_2-20120614/14717_1 /TAXON_ID=2838 /ORGANISM="Odontella" /LENGTH=141 /DNA_ID=CAMNT_0000452715 /DNA_START=223 /DNA_END=648 /DNA_ORIENTATION=+ /assembly_acc=CAM_ASM_000160
MNQPEIFRSVDPKNAEALLALAVVLSILGIVILLRQCSNIRRQMGYNRLSLGYPRRQRDDADLAAHRADLVLFREEVRRSQEESRAEMEADMRALRDFQNQTSVQLAELSGALRQLVDAQKSERGVPAARADSLSSGIKRE